MTRSPAQGGADLPTLVIGGAGFIGSNLSDAILRDGGEVLVFDSLARPGVERNLAWLTARHGARLRFVRGDIRNAAAVDDVVTGVGAVFHLAGQVAVTSSLDDPAHDFAVNAQGTLTVLEAIRRRAPRVPVLFASTNKVYGSLADLAVEPIDGCYLPRDPQLRANGIGESRPLDFCTPYGCSKGAADQYVLDYARSFGLRSAVLRMSCIYGPRQFGTEDQGWVAHFLISALRGAPITLYGDGMQVRDILHVDDAVAAYRGRLADIDAQCRARLQPRRRPRQRGQPAPGAGCHRRPGRAAARPAGGGLARRRPVLLRRRHPGAGGRDRLASDHRLARGVARAGGLGGIGSRTGCAPAGQGMSAPA